MRPEAIRIEARTSAPALPDRLVDGRFAERGIFDDAVARGNRTAVSAVDRPVSPQDIEILADRNLGGFEVAGEFGDQNSTLTAQQITDTGYLQLNIRYKTRSALRMTGVDADKTKR